MALYEEFVLFFSIINLHVWGEAVKFQIDDKPWTFVLLIRKEMRSHAQDHSPPYP